MCARKSWNTVADVKLYAKKDLYLGLKQRKINSGFDYNCTCKYVKHREQEYKGCNVFESLFCISAMRVLKSSM